MFQTRPVRITVLNDRSDFNTRYDLFERLNTGGVTLHPQEIRNCVYLGEFNNFIKTCSEDKHFMSVVKLTKNAERTGNMEELVLKFFGYYEERDNFLHGVKDFLNDYMSNKTTSFKNKAELKKVFDKTFSLLDSLLPMGIVRGNRVNITPLVLFEAISIGVADILKAGRKVDGNKLRLLLDDDTLNKLTTGATNSKSKLLQRIDYVKNNAMI
jgi:hypothetical protein